MAQSHPHVGIRILANPARTRTHSASPTIHEEDAPSHLSTICRPFSPSGSPVSPRIYTRTSSLPSIQNTHSSSASSVFQSRSPPQITILNDREREKREAHPRPTPSPKSILINSAGMRSLPSIQNTHSPLPSSVSQFRSPPHITILSDPEREKREAHPLFIPRPKSILLNTEGTRSLPSTQNPHLSSPSVRQSHSPRHITIISNLKKEKREAHPHSTQGTKSIQKLVAALALKQAPTITITPISILKASTPPAQTPAPTPALAADKPVHDAVKDNKVKFVLPDVVIDETGQDVRYPETGMDTDTTVTSRGELLGVPLVDWRGRLEEDSLARYYPKEHPKEQFVRRLHSMVRSGSRSAAARRRDQARRRRQIANTATAASTPPSTAPIVGRTRL